MELYENDKVLKPALVSALSDNAVAADMAKGQGGMNMGGRGGPGQYVPLMQAAGKFLAQPDGPEIAVVGLEGWDTHAGQNPALQQRFAALDNSISALRDSLGPAWDKTAIVAISEFGRTVRVNGAGGTDHGTGGLAILAGGAIKGGKVYGDLPGLKASALFENRDLNPTVDARSVFKGLLRDHLGWVGSDLDRSIFPDSAAAKAYSGLV
jgi:uncharacterized protein (DUF1501 family)